MRPNEIKVGMRVMYRPSLNDPRAFAGTVREEPWQLGGGTWVTHLTDMEPAYGKWRGMPDRKHVHAASIEALSIAPPTECPVHGLELKGGRCSTCDSIQVHGFNEDEDEYRYDQE